MKLTWPRAETATDDISMAADPDLMTATKVAIQEMVDFAAATRHMTKHQGPCVGPSRVPGERRRATAPSFVPVSSL